MSETSHEQLFPPQLIKRDGCIAVRPTGPLGVTGWQRYPLRKAEDALRHYEQEYDRWQAMQESEVPA